MALSALKTWVAGEVLTASDLNAEFSRIYNNGAGTLSSPRTTLLDLNGAVPITLDADGDTSISALTDDVASIFVGPNSDVFEVKPTGVYFNGDPIQTRTLDAPVVKNQSSVSHHRITHIEGNQTLESRVLGF